MSALVLDPARNSIFYSRSPEYWHTLAAVEAEILDEFRGRVVHKGMNIGNWW
jgi:hypothetical protein